MNKAKLTKIGEMLQRAEKNIELTNLHHEAAGSRSKIHVPNAGNVLLHAYEQLRNASENIEDHLLIQRAILRFFQRNLSFVDKKPTQNLASELVIELTQAEYLQNNTISRSTVKKLDEIIKQLYAAYWAIEKFAPDVKRADAQRWVLELLSVRAEHMFNDPIRVLSFARIAHAHFLGRINIADFVVEPETVDVSQYETLLYVGIHKALLRSDDANIRADLSNIFSVEPTKTKQFIEFNQDFDEISQLKTSGKISRVISKNGAPLRILRATFLSQRGAIVDVSDIANRAQTLELVDQQIDNEYRHVRKSLNSGVIRSIIFLLITKALIGLFIEIPYDVLVHGSIIVLPLLINLLFPPLFIAITALTIKLPKEANKRALVEYLDSMIFGGNEEALIVNKGQATTKSYAFNTVYIIMFALVFLLAAQQLFVLEFNIVQGVIFFIFLSTASFLGYRLTLQVKELEIVSASQGILALLRDFFYAPFIFLGQHISYRFGRMNIVAQILDGLIDLPLKTIFRLARQWTVFLNNKKEELL